VLVNRYAAARGDAVPAQPPQLAAATPESKQVSSVQPVFAPDNAEISQAYASAARMSELPQMDAAPVFHGLFRTNARREAVAPVVSALWTAPSSVAAATPKDDPQQTAPKPEQSNGTFNLFQDSGADARALFRGRV
jgi:hypothetical protein